MKKDKKKMKSVLIEVIGEILLTLLCLLIGMLVVSLFGVDFKSPDTNYDLIILLGVVVFLVVLVVVYALFQWLKKIIQSKHKK